MTTEALRRGPLPVLLADELRRRLYDHEWGEGDQLPSESALSAEYAVSRATVRAALKTLEAAGLVKIRHGVGTFVTPFGPAIRAGLQELRSMTATIAEQGHRPGAVYRTKEVRPATEEEAEQLSAAPGTPVLSLERALLSDGVVVAFATDVINAELLPPRFDPQEITGSVFDFLERHDRLPDQAVAAVRAVISHEVGWGPGRSERGLYLCLDQTQFLPDGQILSVSHIYFVEDRFRFLIARKR